MKVDAVIVLYGFAKSERKNIEPDELEDLRLVARGWLDATERSLEAAIKDGAIQEAQHDEKSDA